MAAMDLAEAWPRGATPYRGQGRQPGGATPHPGGCCAEVAPPLSRSGEVAMRR